MPTPTPAEREHSDRLVALLRAEIVDAGGQIPFSRFMQQALYASGLGYYQAGQARFGSAGDFVTAPELGSLFARCLARQCAEVLSQLGSGQILEFGAGRGYLAADLLAELAGMGCLPERYLILETSPSLEMQQREVIAARVPKHQDRVQWLSTLPEPGFCGVMLANEVLDAMPVERFRVSTQGPRRLAVNWQQGRFHWTDAPMPAALTSIYEQRVGPESLVVGYESELHLVAEAWVASIAGVLEHGVALLIDYGFPAREYYHPQRELGSLMCHYRHRAHSDPLILVGLQDISAHLDFTGLAESAVAHGLGVAGYTQQAPFLLSLGLTELIEQMDLDEGARLLINNEAKKLTLPSEMGELFKVIAFTRGFDGSLSGFKLHDHRNRL